MPSKKVKLAAKAAARVIPQAAVVLTAVEIATTINKMSKVKNPPVITRGERKNGNGPKS